MRYHCHGSYFHQSSPCCSAITITQTHSTVLTIITVTNIRISTDILWRVFHVSTELVPHTFVSGVNRRNNDARTNILQRGSGLHHSVDRVILIQTYTEPVPLKYGKLATKCPLIYGYVLKCTVTRTRHS